MCTILYSLKAWGLCPSFSQRLFVQKLAAWVANQNLPFLSIELNCYGHLWAGLYTGSGSNGKRGISHRRVVGNSTYRTVCTFWVTEEFWVFLTLLHWSFYRTDNSWSLVVDQLSLSLWRGTFLWYQRVNLASTLRLFNQSRFLCACVWDKFVVDTNWRDLFGLDTVPMGKKVSG